MFDAEVEITQRLQAIGYVEVRAMRDNVLSMSGWGARGHEFHFFQGELLGGEGVRIRDAGARA